MLYFLEDRTDRKIAVLRLPNIGELTRDRDARRNGADAAAACRAVEPWVVGASAACGARDEHAAAAMVAAGLGRSTSTRHCFSAWITAPADLADRLRRADIGRYRTPFTLAELVLRGGQVAPPLCPSHDARAHAAALALLPRVRPADADANEDFVRAVLASARFR